MNTRFLRKYHPCNEAIVWLATQPDWETAWQRCEQGEWMLWVLGELTIAPGSPERRKLVGCCVECAELALPIFQKQHPNDNRVKDCVQACRNYAKGLITLNQLNKISDESDAAADSAYAAAGYTFALTETNRYVASAYAAYAADSVTAAARSATDSTYVTRSVAYAVAANHIKMLKQCADIVRKHYPTPPTL